MSKVVTDETTASSPVVQIEDKFYSSPKAAESATADERSETPVKTGAVQTEAATEPAETDTEPETPVNGKKSPRVSWSELRSKADRAEARAELLERQLAEARQAPTKPAESLPAKPDAPANGEPKSSDFDDLDAFITAREKWSRTQWEAEASEKQRITDAEAKSAKHLEGWNAKETALAAKHPEYPEVFNVFLAVAQSNPALATEVFESEVGPELALYLGANKEELARFRMLTGRALSKAIGVLETKVAEKQEEKQVPEKTITKAPRPLGSVAGVAASVPKTKAIEDRFYG